MPDPNEVDTDQVPEEDKEPQPDHDESLNPGIVPDDA